MSKVLIIPILYILILKLSLLSPKNGEKNGQPVEYRTPEYG